MTYIYLGKYQYIKNTSAEKELRATVLILHLSVYVGLQARESHYSKKPDAWILVYVKAVWFPDPTG